MKFKLFACCLLLLLLLLLWRVVQREKPYRSITVDNSSEQFDTSLEADRKVVSELRVLFCAVVCRFQALNRF